DNVPTVKGKNGWRLRVLYPENSSLAKDLIKQFETDPDLKDFAEKYGYTAISTSDPIFCYWYDSGYPINRTSLVLIDNKNTIVRKLTGNDIPEDARDIFHKLRFAVDGRRSDRWYARSGHKPA